MRGLKSEEHICRNLITWHWNLMTSLSLHISSWWRCTSTRLKLSDWEPVTIMSWYINSVFLFCHSIGKPFETYKKMHCILELKTETVGCMHEQWITVGLKNSETAKKKMLWLSQNVNSVVLPSSNESKRCWWNSSLIWVYAVCLDLSNPQPRIIMLHYLKPLYKIINGGKFEVGFL